MMKKTFLIFIVLFFLGLNNTSAYKVDETIQISIKPNNTWNNVYDVPIGYDLVINKILVKYNNSSLQLRDNGGVNKMDQDFKKGIYDYTFTFKDNIEAKSFNDTFTLFGYLVSEDESIENYVEGNSSAWNKHIFNKEDIDFIYFREFIFFIFLMVIKFFEFIIGRKLIMK